ncbi:hypothetical protein [Wolbachia endosymbiont (group A) of Scambus nigricans]|uniref:hypothetical protein n=1 Tax=Wolbachia endosymbiont (group A) of Scambus nigricans TaxID=2954055 RepID=UPI00222FD448|nr:hypothetical protein [Wolbachia endosymbiont (group A) of Scambus nigricans]
MCEHLPNDEAIENIAKRLQKSIDDAKNTRSCLVLMYSKEKKVINNRLFDTDLIPPHGAR